ncbi:MAG: SpoIID/LytB domain-containing protein [Ruminococcaceae bacterium]|nr:SpoIID/LytB domain-containing protein [Oscillospiraceae bacterium]
MKKLFFVLIINIMSLFLFSTYVNASYDVSDRVRIGVKYGSSAISNPTVSSTTKSFDFYSVNEDVYNIGSVDAKKVSISSSLSYLIVEQSQFESINSALEYCNKRENLVPYIKDENICAVMEEIYTPEELLINLETARSFNETAFIVEPDSNLIKVTDEFGKTLLLFCQTESYNLGIGASDDGLIDFGKEETYRDVIEFVKKGNAFNIISNITMQHYLYSVVPAEIGASAPLEAQKAQAVCARTYYEENIKRHKADGFSLCATTHCQMYIGTKWERAQSNKAVDETENMIITYNGKPISAVYFAHSGGRTANVEDVWGNPYPYLKSVEDKYCTDYSWEVKINYSDLTKKMNDKGYNLGTVTSVKISKMADTGTVTGIIIKGTNGQKEFLRESVRTILGVKSQNFIIPSGNEVSVDANQTKYTLKEYAEFLAGKKPPVSAPKLNDDTIYGKGNGHNVGFSQHGAMGYAENEGWDYITILKHYYQGVEIEGE